MIRADSESKAVGTTAPRHWKILTPTDGTSTKQGWGSKRTHRARGAARGGLLVGGWVAGQCAGKWTVSIRDPGRTGGGVRVGLELPHMHTRTCATPGPLARVRGAARARLGLNPVSLWSTSRPETPKPSQWERKGTAEHPKRGATCQSYLEVWDLIFLKSLRNNVNRPPHHPNKSHQSV